MLQPLIILAPLGALAYYSSQGPKSDKKAEKDTKKHRSEKTWIPENTWVYLEDPLKGPRTYPGDHMEYDLQAPYGTVQKAMETAETPVQALAILGDYSAKKDNITMNVWTDHVKPRREIAERDLTMPVTQVKIIGAGSQPDKEIRLGSRFYDQPVPRWTGTDRYHKRKVTVPWYLTP